MYRTVVVAGYATKVESYLLRAYCELGTVPGTGG